MADFDFSPTVSATVRRNATEPAAGTEKAEFLELARKRFRTSADSESQLRFEQLEDQRFRASEQWPPNVKSDREIDGRPCLTINRLPAFIKQVTNQQRASKPSIQINPVDSGSDPKTAEVLQGLIRHIEIQSQADVAYDTACDHQVTIGRGYIRVVVEWSEIDPWVQEIRIKRVRNPFMVYFDPSVEEVDYRDARYAFVVEDIPKDEFKARFGIEALRSAEEFSSIGDRAPEWMPEGRIRVAEYYYVDVKKERISKLSNGQEMPESATKDQSVADYMARMGITVLRSRTIDRRVVKWAKITGSHVLEEAEWPGRYIPIIPVLGDEIDVNGKVDYRGMVRDARDPQRMYNYWVTAETETIALAPRAPMIGAEGQFEGHEQKWNLANRRNWPYLEYKPISVSGVPSPPPQRQAYEPPIMAIVNALRQADNDMKAVTGLYDASLGERGPQEAARAILARQHQGELGNSNWLDNLSRAIRSIGRVVLDLIPHIYDAPRVVRIIGLDNQPMAVMVHTNADDALPATDQIGEGVSGIYNLGVGHYDVTVSVGPNIQSRRQEAVEAMTALMQAFPPAAPVISDIMAENMDWPGAPVIAKRLRKLVPPDVLEDGPPSVPPQVQQKMAQMEQMVTELQAQLQEAGQIIQTKRVENETRERIAALQEQTKLALAEMELMKAQTAEYVKSQSEATKIEHQSALEAVKLQNDRLKQITDHRHEAAMQDDQQHHEFRIKTGEWLHDAETHVAEVEAQHGQKMVELAAKREEKFIDVATRREEKEIDVNAQKEQTAMQLAVRQTESRQAAKARPTPKKS